MLTDSGHNTIEVLKAEIEEHLEEIKILKDRIRQLEALVNGRENALAMIKQDAQRIVDNSTLL